MNNYQFRVIIQTSLNCLICQKTSCLPISTADNDFRECEFLVNSRDVRTTKVGRRLIEPGTVTACKPVWPRILIAQVSWRYLDYWWVFELQVNFDKRCLFAGKVGFKRTPDFFNCSRQKRSVEQPIAPHPRGSCKRGW